MSTAWYPPRKFRKPLVTEAWYLRLFYWLHSVTYRWRWWQWYKSYGKSRAWQNKRERVLARDGFRCTRCGSAFRLQVHHLTYDRVGNERMSDLVTLCHGCHQRLHGRRF